MSELNSRVIKALSQVIDPELRRPITELGMVGEITETSSGISVAIKLTVSHCPAAEQIENNVSKVLVAEFGEVVQVVMQVMTTDELTALKAQLRGSAEAKSNPFTAGTSTRVFLFGSGKGGVGKSTITANVAVELASQGYEVGLIDADIFGFSIPGQLGLKAKPTRLDDMILPPVIHGVKVISIGMFLPSNEPVAWRGPMLHKAVEQFLTDVYWGSLDFLLIDMPPGTGDVAISVGQLLPTAKSIVITTPQMSAAIVAERSGSAGLKTGQEIFGVVENSSYLIQSDGTKNEIYGSGGGQEVARSLSERTGTAIPLLGQIPISTELSAASDAGMPLVLTNATDPAALAIKALATSITEDKLPKTSRTLNVKLS
jgi:ATP-binding protein involved in chromosome partitioning